MIVQTKYACFTLAGCTSLDPRVLTDIGRDGCVAGGVVCMVG
jgi:hypothetical protein